MVMRGLEQTKRVSIEYSMIIERCGMEWMVDPMMDLCIGVDFDKISKNGSNIYEWNQINQTILEIDFDRTCSNEWGSSTLRRFGISKYEQYSIFRNTFQCHCKRKTETPSFRIDNRCEFWKIYIPSLRIISLVLRIVNEQDLCIHIPASAQLPSVMDCRLGRSIQIISFKFIQYFRLLLIRIHRMHICLM